MELNRKILRIGIIIISLSILIFIGFTIVMKLDKPVFLKNYIELMITPSHQSYRGSEFVLKYITNVSDKRKITDIYFNEYPDLVFCVGNTSSGIDTFPEFPLPNHLNEEVYGRYILRNLYVTLDGRSLGKFDKIELNNAKITFDNGEVIDVDLGRIIFYNYLYEHSNYKDEHFDFLSSSISSDMTSSTKVEVKEDITLTNVESLLLEDMDDLVQIKIGDFGYKDISDIQYKSGDVFKINSKFQCSKDILRKFTLYNIEPKIYYKNSNENPFYIRINNIRYENYDFNSWEMMKYLKARGEI